MSIPLKLDDLSIEEKIELMESLWADLSRRASVHSPDWHGGVLAARARAVEEGTELQLDWEEAKKRIRDELE